MLPTSDSAREPRGDRGRQLRRYGPLALIAVMLLVFAATVALGGNDGGSGDDHGDQVGAASWTEVSDPPGAPEPTGLMPVTYAEAKEAGAAGDHRWSDTCDTDRGTLAVPSVYALPCVPAFDGGNGGATVPGVTAEEVKVVYYAPELGGDLNSMLGSMDANDTAEQRLDTLREYVEVLSSMAELYGRRIVVEPFTPSGAFNDVVAARADATDVIAMEPFLVVGGPLQDRGTFAQELAGAHIPCFGCSGILPDAMIEDLAPYHWPQTPSVEQVFDTVDAWMRSVEGGDAATANAEFAGGELQGQPRKIGVIHLDQDPPLHEETASGRSEGVDLVESYLLDVAGFPVKATELVARFRSEGITTIMFTGDPFMPSYLTAAATDQDYYPEWVFTGITLTDSNTFGRQYDAAQMEHAFGISKLAAPTEQDLQAPIRLYRWYYGEGAMPRADSQYALVWSAAAWLVSGIHMAGPELSPETFARGLFRIPPAGGGPSTPQISYGNWGFFDRVDYNGIDDASEIWWDPSVRAEDENGEVGQGAWRRSNGADRFTPEDSPPPRPFTDADSAVTVLEQLPPEDQAPDYPPPAGSPAAVGS